MVTAGQVGKDEINEDDKRKKGQEPDRISEKGK